MQNDDLLAGAICGVVSLIALVLFHSTDKNRPETQSEPLLVRVTYVGIAGSFFVRSLDLFHLAQIDVPVPGKINGWAVAGAVAVASHFAARVFFVIRERLPSGVWDRVREVIENLRRHPEGVPAVIPKDQAPAVLQILGANVNARPGGLDDERTRDG